MSANAYPLQWPEGWTRTPQHQQQSDSRFRGSVYSRTELTVARTLTQLRHELQLLGAKEIIVSTNLRLRQDGWPLSDNRRVEDPGVAVYFTLKKRPLVMARDAYQTVAGNLRSLGLAIEAMRQLERHGGDKMMERAFTGFVAIAPPDWKKPWREVFGVKPDWTGNIHTLFRQKAMERHPDRGGHDTLMAELNVAYEEAKTELGI
jgi:hypothetical protein